MIPGQRNVRGASSKGGGAIGKTKRFLHIFLIKKKGVINNMIHLTIRSMLKILLKGCLPNERRSLLSESLSSVQKGGSARGREGRGI